MAHTARWCALSSTHTHRYAPGAVTSARTVCNASSSPDARRQTRPRPNPARRRAPSTKAGRNRGARARRTCRRCADTSPCRGYRSGRARTSRSRRARRANRRRRRRVPPPIARRCFATRRGRVRVGGVGGHSHHGETREGGDERAETTGDALASRCGGGGVVEGAAAPADDEASTTHTVGPLGSSKNAVRRRGERGARVLVALDVLHGPSGNLRGERRWVRGGARRVVRVVRG